MRPSVTLPEITAEFAYFQTRMQDGNKDYQLIRQHLDFASARVLEVGCGSGGKAVFFSTLGCTSVTGMDIHPDVALGPGFSECIPGRGKIHFVQSDVEALPFPAGAFDLVLAHDVMEHLQEPEAALAEIQRVLAADGCLSVIMPHYYGLSGNHLWNYFGGRFWRYLHPHLIIPSPLLKRMVVSQGRKRGYSQRQIDEEWDQYLALNRLPIRTLLAWIGEKFEFAHFTYRHGALKPIVARVPKLAELFSYGIVLVARKKQA